MTSSRHSAPNLRKSKRSSSTLTASPSPPSGKTPKASTSRPVGTQRKRSRRSDLRPAPEAEPQIRPGSTPFCRWRRRRRRGWTDPAPPQTNAPHNTHIEQGEVVTSKYEKAVAEARRLVKRSEEDQWRLAELTWEQVEGGKSRAQWARDVGVGRTSVMRWYKIWAR